MPTDSAAYQYGLGTEKPPACVDDWELDDDLREAQRMIEAVRFQAGGARGSLPINQTDQCRGVDPAHDALADWHAHVKIPPAMRTGLAANSAGTNRESNRRDQTTGRSPALCWVAYSLGLMSFVCGAVLLGWSLFAGRADLWNYGLPMALAGQAVLLMGVVLQMDFLWNSNRKTNETLGDLDEGLDDLKHATNMLGTTHSTAAQSFYAHMAGGGSPQMMLADLKGQLDLLAMRMSRERAY
jgi:hypothetical protein